MKYCKMCNKELTKDLINNNRKFCSRKCRIEWIAKHKIKCGKKNKYKTFGFGVKFDCKGQSINFE